MSDTTAKIEWDSQSVIQTTDKIMDDVSKQVAEKVADDAKKILKRKAKTTSEKGLLSQFDIIKSRYKQGGYVVTVQGFRKWKKPYHASFVELGTFKDEAKPFLRPAYKKNQRYANKLYQKELEKL